MQGDGNFRWWWADHAEADSWSGPFESREEAIKDARHERCGEPFAICEADSVVVENFSVFDTYTVLDNLVDANEECWPAYAPDSTATADDNRALELELAATLKAWFERVQPLRVWSFGTQRNVEAIEPAEDLR